MYQKQEIIPVECELPVFLVPRGLCPTPLDADPRLLAAGNNTLRVTSQEGIIFEKTQGRVIFEKFQIFDRSSFIVINNNML